MNICSFECCTCDIRSSFVEAIEHNSWAQSYEISWNPLKMSKVHLKYHIYTLNSATFPLFESPESIIDAKLYYIAKYSNIFEYSNDQANEWGIFECFNIAHSLETLLVRKVRGNTRSQVLLTSLSSCANNWSQLRNFPKNIEWHHVYVNQGEASPMHVGPNQWMSSGVSTHSRKWNWLHAPQVGPAVGLEKRCTLFRPIFTRPRKIRPYSGKILSEDLVYGTREGLPNNPTH